MSVFMTVANASHHLVTITARLTGVSFAALEMSPSLGRLGLQLSRLFVPPCGSLPSRCNCRLDYLMRS